MRKYSRYVSNLNVLLKANKEDLENEFIISGIIDKFFVQFELGWKLLKELMQYEGRSDAASGSPRSIIKAAYTVYDFIDEEIWLAMLQERNNMTHVYDGEAAKRLVNVILMEYIPEFEKLKKELRNTYGALLESDERF